MAVDTGWSRPLVFVVSGRPVPWQRIEPGSLTVRELRRFVATHKGRLIEAVANELVRLLTARKGGGRRPEATTRWEGQVGAAALSAMTQQGLSRIPAGHRIRLYIDVRTDTRGGDVDNYQKAVQDGCNRVVWHDDCQVRQWGGTLQTHVSAPYVGCTVHVEDLGPTT